MQHFVAITARGRGWVGQLSDPLVLCWSAAVAFAVVMLFVVKPWSGTEESDSSVASFPSPVPAAKGDTSVGQAADPSQKVGPVLFPPETVESPAETEDIAEKDVVAKHEPRFPVMAERPRREIVAVRPEGIVAEPVAISTPAPPEFDVTAALEQPIRRFELKTAVPFSELLPEIEELAAVPIHADPKRIPGLASLLAKRVSIQLKDTTVGEILRALADQAGLDYDVQPDGIHLRAKLQEVQPRAE